jgi:integrase
MSDQNSTNAKPKPQRPQGSPLFWHADPRLKSGGRWSKKIRGKVRSFGMGSHDDALAEYERRRAEYENPRQNQDEPEGLTVHKLCEKFLTWKKQLRDTRQLSPVTFDDYSNVCKLLQRSFGKDRLVASLRPDDFQELSTRLSKRWGLVRLGSTINKIKVVFNFAFEAELIAKKVSYGVYFQRPKPEAIDQEREERGYAPKLFEAHEIRAMLDKASQPLKTMIYLGINAALGNTDIGKLPIKAVNLQSGWLVYSRRKTRVPRRCPLWPETVQAIQEWLTVRPEAVKDEDKGLLFFTSTGRSWLTPDNPISHETARLMKACSLDGHRNFYCFRHTFQTQGDESGEFIGVRRIMGHKISNDIAEVYREKISDSRLSKVTEHVRAWLFAEPTAEGQEPDVIPMSKVV